MKLTGIGATNEHARLIIESYERLTGKKLIEGEEAVPGKELEWLYQLPFVVLSHGREPDPVLNFGNLTAQKLWEMDWATFTDTPSRLTAEPMERGERDRFLRIVDEQGFVDNYTGIRISSTGIRFYIVNATVWNLIDENGNNHGQAATFQEHKYI
ncbi:MEKHLA domain-containing protein [Paenibacillus glycanilyticus]|uniref:MEKHLA domain-containing protein n=1 Tax=Paenibacillus glycanilyticus TaxID=126569 RepID=UPI00203C2D3D|nr:MEKHLA domain-containing protein [Paenibacillus glycanilyticus]MCM3629816.1 MEKHLA domain-containing protein [Paenibacillus glycanilyticus]